jgi:hypothetical protein
MLKSIKLLFCFNLSERHKKCTFFESKLNTIKVEERFFDIVETNTLF